MGAVVGAIGSIVGGGLQAQGAEKAGDAAAEAAREGARTQQYMFDVARSDSAPWRAGGERALYAALDLMGVGPDRAGMDQQIAELEAQIKATESGIPGLESARSSAELSTWDRVKYVDPLVGMLNGGHFGRKEEKDERNEARARLGEAQQTLADQRSQLERLRASRAAMGDRPYEYTITDGARQQMEEGTKGLLASAAMGGGVRSGRTLSALERLRSGLVLQDKNNQIGQLFQAAGLGQTSTAQTGALGAATGQGIAQSQAQAGQARGLGYLGQANAYGNTISGLTNLYGQYQQRTA